MRTNLHKREETIIYNTKSDIYPWTKLVVPSRGSTIHVGSSVSSVTPQAAVVSSPMN